MADRDSWDSLVADKNIFRHHVDHVGPTTQVLLFRFKNYLGDLLLGDPKDMLRFLRRNRLIMYNPDNTQEHDWRLLKPTRQDDEKSDGQPVPPLSLTIFIDRYANQKRQRYQPFDLRMVIGRYDARENFSALSWSGGNESIIATTLHNIQFVPAELCYTLTRMNAWQTTLDGTDKKTKEKLQKELDFRLDLARTLKLKDTKYTADVGPDYLFKPIFLELLAPVGENAGLPKLMMTSVMFGSLLCFRPHPKRDDGSLLLCHITGTTVGGGSATAKAFEREVKQHCRFYKDSMTDFMDTGVWGPCEYGGDSDPTTNTPVLGSCVVFGVWSDAQQQWTLMAQMYNSDDEVAGVITLYGQGAPYPLSQDWLDYLKNQYDPAMS